jgi:SPP1 gp7 family putative phage head morphogenesis protein
MATAYWEARAALRQAAYDRANNEVVKSVSRTYDRVASQLEDDIDSIMATYTRKTGLSPRDAYEYLRSGVPEGVMDNLRARVSMIANKVEKRKLETIINTGAYRARISRIDAIKASARVGLTEAAEVELSALKGHLEGISDTAYSRMMFDTQKALGVGFESAGVPRKALNEILRSKWAGVSYSDSLWMNRDATASMLDKALMEMSTMGKLSDPTLRDIRGMVDLSKWKGAVKSKFKTKEQYSKYAANRLIRTESAYVAGQSTKVAFEECEIDKYEFVSILDNKTSTVCQGLDGKIFNTADAEVGVNYYPMHPFCRSNCAPVIANVDRTGWQRRGRDKDNNSVLLPRDMNYSTWKRWQNDGCPEISKWMNKRIS